MPPILTANLNTTVSPYIIFDATIISMKRKIFIITGIVVIIGAGAAAFYFSGMYDKVFKPTPAQPIEQIVTIEGQVVCLPPIDEDAPHTLECAIGLHSTDDKYYGLSGSTGSELAAAAGSDKKAKVTGALQEQTSDKYKMNGIIAVKNFTFSEKTE